MKGFVTLLYQFTIPRGTLPWQPIKVAKSAFLKDKSSLLHCHSEAYCNIAIPISKGLVA